MIDWKKEMYTKIVMNRSNTFEIFSKIENPSLDNRNVIRVLKIWKYEWKYW